MVRWIEKVSPSRVLEPSCGDGVFFDALGARDLSSKILGFELDDTEAKKAKERAASAGLSDVSIRASDFLGWALKAMDDKSERFDAVIGNPPFIRYQYLPPLFQDRAEAIFERLGCKFTKHTNAWVSFILARASSI